MGRVGIPEGSTLGPLLFVLVMEEATRGEQRGLCELLCVDDPVAAAETRAEASDRFDSWKREVEERGLKISMGKTKVMVSVRQPNRRPESCGKNVGVN